MIYKRFLFSLLISSLALIVINVVFFLWRGERIRSDDFYLWIGISLLPLVIGVVLGMGVAAVFHRPILITLTVATVFGLSLAYLINGYIIWSEGKEYAVDLGLEIAISAVLLFLAHRLLHHFVN